jgi:Nucleoside 2-deoxyribosyltransferase/pfkB family carbohydrate kinase
MNAISVVGGVYRERCRLPIRSDETWGSGGRAAAVIAGLGLKVVLHSPVDSRTAPILSRLAESFKFQTAAVSVDISPEFRYEHGLSVPIIWPSVTDEAVQFDVDAESVLIFGMLEAKCRVRARNIVYDPQNPTSPKPIQYESGSRRLAYVLNGAELYGLTGVDDPLNGAERIVREFGAEVVVVKQGTRGALVYENGKAERIPAYRTDSVWPIGSGDVFAAVFAARWAVQGLSAIEASSQASRAAALYCDSRVLPIASEEFDPTSAFPFATLSIKNKPLSEEEFHIYLAGPFFNIGQRWLLEESLLAFRGMGLRVFSPLHEIGMGEAHQVAAKDIDGLRRCRAVFALVDGIDAGTIFEVGYARSLGKPVVALAESTTEEPLKMMVGMSCDVVPDFVSAIYKAAWIALE